MNSQIRLTVTEGSLQGKEVVLDHRGDYVVGRAGDCDIHLPVDAAYSGVSRHHCVLAFDPPLLRVRDLGSLNGTYVNGDKIGQRYHSDPPDTVERENFSERELSDGDLLQVYDTVFRVGIDDLNEEAESARSL
jgi:pSer/pThr/pTyr-binding forkhead associated (FHA) protein